jgi:hypothetical protein
MCTDEFTFARSTRVKIGVKRSKKNEEKKNCFRNEKIQIFVFSCKTCSTSIHKFSVFISVNTVANGKNLVKSHCQIDFRSVRERTGIR